VLPSSKAKDSTSPRKLWENRRSYRRQFPEPPQKPLHSVKGESKLNDDLVSKAKQYFQK